MTNATDLSGHYVDPANVPLQFPTHKHSAEFWENLGRAVATFGFLEEVLGKAICALTGTRPAPNEGIDAALQKFQGALEKALTDPLGALIVSFEKAARLHPKQNAEGFDYLMDELRKAKVYRDVICHASWQAPVDGKSRPLFVNKKMMVSDMEIDEEFLVRLQRHAAELACGVINEVTQRGYQFPGSQGPGQQVW